MRKFDTPDKIANEAVSNSNRIVQPKVEKITRESPKEVTETLKYVISYNYIEF